MFFSLSEDQVLTEARRRLTTIPCARTARSTPPTRGPRLAGARSCCAWGVSLRRLLTRVLEGATVGGGEAVWSSQPPIRVWNAWGEVRAGARVTTALPARTVWMRDGRPGLNDLTSGASVISHEAVELFGFSGG